MHTNYHRHIVWESPWIWGLGILVLCLVIFLLVSIFVFGPAFRESQRQAEYKPAATTGAGTEETRPTPPQQTQPVPTEQPQVQTTPKPEQPAIEPPVAEQIVIRDPAKVQQLARQNRPMDVYVLIPGNTDQPNPAPEEIIVSPQDAQVPQGDYQLSTLPAFFKYNGRTYVIVPGRPSKIDESQLTSADNVVDGNIIYIMSGRQNTLYLRLEPDEDYYARYTLLQNK